MSMLVLHWSLRFLRKLYLNVWADILGLVSDSGRKEMGHSSDVVRGLSRRLTSQVSLYYCFRWAISLSFALFSGSTSRWWLESLVSLVFLFSYLWSRKYHPHPPLQFPYSPDGWEKLCGKWTWNREVWEGSMPRYVCGPESEVMQ